MTYLMMQHFPLQSAYLCQDCNSIGNNSGACPACASTVLMSLACVLDREVVVAEEGRVLAYTFPSAVAGLSAKVA
jgi:hypothetical protein